MSNQVEAAEVRSTEISPTDSIDKIGQRVDERREALPKRSSSTEKRPSAPRSGKVKPGSRSGQNPVDRSLPDPFAPRMMRFSLDDYVMQRDPGETDEAYAERLKLFREKIEIDGGPLPDWMSEEYKRPYIYFKVLEDGRVCAVQRLLFHWTIHIDLDPMGYASRYCYQTREGAVAALKEWTGTGDPDGWHKHPNSRRLRDPATGRIWIE